MVVFTRASENKWDFNAEELEALTTPQFALVVKGNLNGGHSTALHVESQQVGEFIFIDIYTKLGIAKLASDNGNFEQITFTPYREIEKVLNKARELGVY